MIIGAGAVVGGVLQPIVAGDPRMDWCNVCMTSSAVRVRLYILRWDAAPVFVIPVGLSYACMVCDPDVFGFDDDGDGFPGDAGVPV